jgi:hypothetical protein
MDSSAARRRSSAAVRATGRPSASKPAASQIAARVPMKARSAAVFTFTAFTCGATWKTGLSPEL